MAANIFSSGFGKRIAGLLPLEDVGGGDMERAGVGDVRFHRQDWEHRRGEPEAGHKERYERGPRGSTQKEILQKDAPAGEKRGIGR